MDETGQLGSRDPIGGGSHNGGNYMGTPLNARRFDGDPWAPSTGDDAMETPNPQWGGGSAAQPTAYQSNSQPTVNHMGNPTDSVVVPQPATIPIPPEALLLPEDYGHGHPGHSSTGAMPPVSAPPVSGAPVSSGGSP